MESVAPFGRAVIDCNPCASVSIHDSDFENVNGTDAGVLSATAASIRISGCNFDQCSGRKAGVIFSDVLNKDATIESSAFSNWHSPAYWGVYVKSSNYHPNSELDIIGTSFSGDPAVLSEGPANVNIQESTFNILDSVHAEMQGIGVAIEFAERLPFPRISSPPIPL